jgi:hypothetical protein
MGYLCQRTSQLNTGRSPSNDHEPQVFLRFGNSIAPLGPLKRLEDSFPDKERIIQVLQSRRILLLLIIPKVGVSVSHGYNEIIIVVFNTVR